MPFSSPPTTSGAALIAVDPDCLNWLHQHHAEPQTVSRIQALSDLLSRGQLQKLAELWPALPDEWASLPEFRSLREHTRFYIELLRKEQ